MASARVLVVDDEPAVLNLVTRMLSGGGYEVLQASGPGQALEMVRNHPPIDLVLSDITMPGMTGTDLVREIALISPDTSALLMTGYAEGFPCEVPVLHKPFTPADVLFTVELVLTKAAQARRALREAAEKSVSIREVSENIRTETEQALDNAAEARRRSAGLLGRKKPH